MTAKARQMLPIASVALALAVSACGSTSSDPPLQLAQAGRFGLGVDYVMGWNVCTVASGDECQPGRRGSAPQGFHYLGGVAVDNDPSNPRHGDVYVADTDNQRVQVLTAEGAFVEMFGWDVNKTKVAQAGATQAEKNLCTEQEISQMHISCGAGVPGTQAGELTYPASIAVDPRNGDVYVEEITAGNFRVDEFTPDGRFVLMLGKGVNRTTGSNLCTEGEIERSHVSCGPGAANPLGGSEQSAFNFPQRYGNLLAVGGPEDLLYVGDEHRVQTFAADGRRMGQISLASISSEPYSAVLALAVDTAGHVYVVYQEATVEHDGAHRATSNVVRELDSHGRQLRAFTVGLAKQPGVTTTLNALAIDSHGRLAVLGAGKFTTSPTLFGGIYDPHSGALLSEFAVPIGFDGVAFSNNDTLYVAATDGEDVLAYTPRGSHGF